MRKMRERRDCILQNAKGKLPSGEMPPIIRVLVDIDSQDRKGTQPPVAALWATILFVCQIVLIVVIHRKGFPASSTRNSGFRRA